jgi:Bacterial protein of unknown function (DUF885)
VPERRLKAVWDVNVPVIRELAGVHEYDGVVMDLSPSGRKAALERLGPLSPGERLADGHDERHLRAAEQAARAEAEAEILRWNPLPHIQNLDLSCYDREYAPEPQRLRAREAHLAQWPEAVGASLESLQDVPAPVAGALLGTVRGLAAGINGTTDVEAAALDAHGRLLRRIEHAAASGNPDASLGATALARLLGQAESMPVDLGRLQERADQERDRLRTRLNEACERLSPGATPARLVPQLLRDHPGEEAIYAAARQTIDEATAFVIDRDLLPPPGGACQVGPAPAARRWAAAMMYWTGPFEDDAPARYYISPPDESWDEEAKHEWLAVFSATLGPAVTVHEVTPGHFAHGQMLRQLARGDVRRSLFSEAFVEGWAHYAQELMVEQGFRADDPRFAVGVYLDALVAVTGLASAIGIHQGAMTVDDATARFEADAFLLGPAARSEATRAAYDPTCGRYTWGKLEIMSLRGEALAAWGAKFSLRRFHEALPPSEHRRSAPWATPSSSSPYHPRPGRRIGKRSSEPAELRTGRQGSSTRAGAHQVYAG